MTAIDRLAQFLAALLFLVSTTAQAASPFRAPYPLPNYTHPTRFPERTQARDRVLEVFAAIDEATSNEALRLELRRICRRESACNWIGPVTGHAGDASGGRARHRAAVRRGLLDPETCSAHRLGDPARWSTYGPFGIAAAWAVPRVGRCVGPEVLDDPRVAARAAVRWIEDLCRLRKACTCADRVRWWAGPLRFDARLETAQLAAITGQCGDQPLWRWIVALAIDTIGSAAG